MLKIGITGGIGTGKSTACRIFEQLGIPVYDADTRAKWITATDAHLAEQIKAHFGQEAYDEKGQFNRVFIAAQVFGHPERLALLNSLVHPAVAADFSKWIAQYEGKAPYILKEAALLYEAGSYQMLDKIIVVSAPPEIKLERILQRDTHRTREDALAIIARQMPDEEKVKRADYVIYNDGQQLLIPQVMEIDRKIREITK